MSPPQVGHECPECGGPGAVADGLVTVDHKAACSIGIRQAARRKRTAAAAGEGTAS
jgi:hypothetical protein